MIGNITHVYKYLKIYNIIEKFLCIYSSLPKLYFNDDAKPGSEWMKFTRKKMPDNNRLWISLEEEESFSSWIALPGHKNNIRCCILILL
jgi:sulfoxide reductase catalytic subunit YedY